MLTVTQPLNTYAQQTRSLTDSAECTKFESVSARYINGQVWASLILVRLILSWYTSVVCRGQYSQFSWPGELYHVPLLPPMCLLSCLSPKAKKNWDLVMAWHSPPLEKQRNKGMCHYPSFVPSHFKNGMEWLILLVSYAWLYRTDWSIGACEVTISARGYDPLLFARSFNFTLENRNDDHLLHAFRCTQVFLVCLSGSWPSSVVWKVWGASARAVFV